MAHGRLVSGSIVAAVVGLLAVTVDAQFPKIRVPKTPAIPGVKGSSPPPAPASPAPAPSPGSGSAAGTAAATTTTKRTTSREFECSDISDDLVDKMLKASEAEQKALEAANKAYAAEMQKAKTKRAEADAIQSKRGQQTVNVMMQNAECKDAFKEKDNRHKEIARLENLVAAADEAGDQQKSDALRKKLDPLNEAVELDADRACGGKGSSALHDCMEKKKVALAKQGIAEPMLTLQAQGECMQDPATSGVAGMTGESQEEQDLRAQADEIERQARENKQKAEDDANKQTREETGMSDHDRAIFAECCIGVQHQDPVWLAQTPAAARSALQKPGVKEKFCQ